MKTKKFKQRSFNLPDDDMKRLKTVALRSGCNFRGKPSVGNLLRKIASGKVKVSK